MATAAGGAAKAADGDGEIGKVVDNGANANKGDKTSVNGIANGIKAIVGVAKKAGVKWEPADSAEAGDANGNKNAGKLFATNGGQGDAGDEKYAALAVSGVSGDQILNAIVADAEGGRRMVLRLKILQIQLMLLLGLMMMLVLMGLIR